MTSGKKGNTSKNQRNSTYRIRVRGVRRDPPNIRKLSKVIAELAAEMMADAERGEKPTTEDTSAIPPAKNSTRSRRRAA